MFEVGVAACVHINEGKSCESFQPAEDAAFIIDPHATKFHDGDTAKAVVKVCEQIARTIGFADYPQKPEGVTAEAHCNAIIDGKAGEATRLHEGKHRASWVQAMKHYMLSGKEEL